MNKLHTLRQVTKPLTETEALEIMCLRYGNVRQNASSDDQVTAQRAADLNRRKAERKIRVSTQRPG